MKLTLACAAALLLAAPAPASDKTLRDSFRAGLAATPARDAARADRSWIHAATRLRAAGKALGVPVGLVNAF